MRFFILCSLVLFGCRSSTKNSETEFSIYAPVIVTAHIEDNKKNKITGPIKCMDERFPNNLMIRVVSTGMKPVDNVNVRVKGSDNSLVLTKISDKTYTGLLHNVPSMSQATCAGDASVNLVIEAVDIDGWKTVSDPLKVDVERETALSH